MYRDAIVWIIFIIPNIFVVTAERHVLVIHTNDMEARFEEISGKYYGVCKPPDRDKRCFGGFARIAQIFQQYNYTSDDDDLDPSYQVIFLHAGNVFIGSAWFNVHKTEIATRFMQELGYHAIALGNHEFDLGPAGLVDYIKGLEDRIVAANLDISSEPALRDTKINKYIAIGEHIRIIGYITPETKSISSPGQVKFSDELDAIKKEAINVDKDNKKIVIALGNSGFNTDKKIAYHVGQVDLVVGGHSHTFLWNGTQPHKEHIDGRYPTIVTQSSGKPVPVVTTYGYTKYLGIINLTFDNDGNLQGWDLHPILLDSKVKQKASILTLLEGYRQEVDILYGKHVGISKIDLTGPMECVNKECNIGNLITDAFLEHARSNFKIHNPDHLVAIINGGEVKGSIEAGPISNGELVQAFPYPNVLFLLTLSGKQLLNALEQMLRRGANVYRGEFPQVSGMDIIADMSKDPLSRIIAIRTQSSTSEKMLILRVNQDYQVITTEFLAQGGDGVTVFKDRVKRKKNLSVLNIDILISYMKRFSPICPRTDGRIHLRNDGNLIKASYKFVFINVSILVLTI